MALIDYFSLYFPNTNAILSSIKVELKVVPQLGHDSMLIDEAATAGWLAIGWLGLALSTELPWISPSTVAA